MYVAKRQGAGAFAYDSAADENSAARLSLLGELRVVETERTVRCMQFKEVQGQSVPTHMPSTLSL